MHTVNYATITEKIKIASSEQGIIYRTKTLLPALAHGQLMYKEYNPSTIQTLDSGVLEKMVQFLTELHSVEQKFFTDHFAWPLAIVHNNMNCTGFLMPGIPSKYYSQLDFPQGPSKCLMEIQYLLNGESDLAKKGITINNKDRYTVLWKTAQALDFLHKHKIAVGNFNPKNLLFSLHENADNIDVYFMNCDAMSINNTTALPQEEIPGWNVPQQLDGSTEPLGTEHSDVYKFGLLALRLLRGNQNANSVQQLNCDLLVKQQICKSLSIDPLCRGTMSEWKSILSHARHSSSRISRATSEKITIAKADDTNLFLNPLEQEFFSEIEYYLKNGGKIDAIDKYTGQTYLSLAVWNEYAHIVKYLLDKGANVNARDQDGSTALHSCVTNKHTHVALALLHHGANIDDANDDDQTPLHYATFFGNFVLTDFLLNQGASVHSRCKQGFTPLHTACSQYGSPEIVQLLIHKGADIQAKDNEENTPLNLALIRERYDIAQILERFRLILMSTSNRSSHR